jgi:putative transposase
MQTLQFTYSQYYNRRYKKTGHVFQGRYQAILCDRQAYLLELVRYLHLNPARMRTPLSPWTYRWSSHAAYLRRTGPVKTGTSAVLEAFHRQAGPARQAIANSCWTAWPRGTRTNFTKQLINGFSETTAFWRRSIGGRLPRVR